MIKTEELNKITIVFEASDTIEAKRFIINQINASFELLRTL